MRGKNIFLASNFFTLGDDFPMYHYLMMMIVLETSFIYSNSFFFESNYGIKNLIPLLILRGVSLNF